MFLAVDVPKSQMTCLVFRMFLNFENLEFQGLALYKASRTPQDHLHKSTLLVDLCVKPKVSFKQFSRDHAFCILAGTEQFVSTVCFQE